MEQRTYLPLVGCHLSIASGLEQPLLTGKRIGCTAIQMFTHSNRQWRIPTLKDAQIDLFKNTQNESGIKVVVAHASYLLNITSAQDPVHTQSINMLKQELLRCNLLGIPYLVIHPGARFDVPVEISIQQTAQFLDTILEKTPTTTMILLENTAGQGTVIGSSFQELSAIRELTSHKKNIGFCFDTCHAFAAGYDFTSSASYAVFWHMVDATIGINSIKVIHLNDSKKEKGSRVDRHEHIGQGKLGLATFSLLMNDPRFSDIPKILETPKMDNLDWDIHNLATIKSLIHTA
jgi:deoxyribonuclease IV